MYAIRGAHTAGSDEEFTGTRLRLQNLDSWANHSGFRREVESDGTITLSYRRPEVSPAALSTGALLTFRFVAAASTPTAQGGHIRSETWLQIEGGPAAAWRDLDRQIVTPLSSLVGLCTLKRCLPVQVEVQNAQGEWLEVIGNGLINQDRQAVSQWDVLVPYRVLTLNGIARWIEQVDRLGPLPPVVADAVARQSELKLETQVLELTTVAEGLHSRLFPDERRMDDETVREIRKRVREALRVQDERDRNVVNGVLTHLHEPSYRRRLYQLAELSEKLLPGATGDTVKWSKRVEVSRNRFAHRAHGFFTELNIDEEATVVESLRWVLAGVLLTQTEVTSDLVRSRVGSLQSYQLFLSRARTQLPSVYG